MGRAVAANGPRDPFAVDETTALAELERTWADGGYHAFSVWVARSGQLMAQISAS